MLAERDYSGGTQRSTLRHIWVFNAVKFIQLLITAKMEAKCELNPKKKKDAADEDALNR